MSNIDDFFDTASVGTGAPRLPPAVKYTADMATTSADNVPIFSKGTSNTFLRILNDLDSAGDLEYTEDDLLKFGVNLTDINTALTLTLDQWTGLYWYDSVDDLFYNLIRDTAVPNVSLVTISRTGTIALVGTETEANIGFAFSTLARVQWWERASQGSGDFTIYSSISGTQVASISSSTGLVTSAAASFVLTDGTDEAHLITNVGYLTNDKKAMLTGSQGFDESDRNNNTIMSFGLSRKDSSGLGLLNFNAFGWAFSETTSDSQVRFEKWDGKVVVTVSATVTGATAVSAMGPRVFEIAAFDTWVHDFCDFIGLDGSQ